MTVSKLDIALRWLYQYLQDGPKPCGDRFNPKRGTVYGDGIRAGMAGMTIRRAADALKVKKKRAGKSWFWSLPEGCKPPKPAIPEQKLPVRIPGRRLKKMIVTYIFE